MSSGKTESVRVEIFGNEYTIKGSHDPEFIQCLAQYVDKKMRETAQNTSLVATNKVAILTALNIAEELFIVKDKSEQTRKEIKEKIEQLINKIDSNIDKKLIEGE